MKLRQTLEENLDRYYRTMSSADQPVSPEDLVSRIPQDLHHITLEGLLPLISLLMVHAQELTSLDGPSKQQLVVKCLDILIERMPFPENKIIEPVVNAIAPGAISGIVTGSKYAKQHCKDFVVQQRPNTRKSILGSLMAPKVLRPNMNPFIRKPPQNPTLQLKVPPKARHVGSSSVVRYPSLGVCSSRCSTHLHV